MADSQSTTTPRHPQSGPNNPNWRGGRSVASNGYILVRVGTGHPLADVRGYAYEHRLVASASLGRWLTPDEQVHHRDGNKQNNAPGNLEVLPESWHRVRHRSTGKVRRLPGEENLSVECACGCGEKLSRYDGSGRPRRFLPGHNPHDAPTERMVLAALSGGAKPRAEIVRVTGKTSHAVGVALSKMRRKGLVENVCRGIWRRAEGNS